MLLTMKQRYVVDVLNKLGCLRRDQLYILTRDHFKTEDYTLSEYQMDEILRQLPFLANEVRVENGVVRLSDHKPEPLRLEAIDVMLELSNGYPIQFSAVHDEDTLLRFALGSDPPRQYTVVAYSDAAAAVETGKNIVWISIKRLKPENLSLAKQQFYAQRQEDGSHRFFGANK